MRVRVLFLGVILLAASGVMWGQPPFQLFPADGQIRDVAVHAPTGTVCVAVYDRNEVRQVNPVTLEGVATVRVGPGPVSLAFSADYAVLACVNHLDGTVSLINMAEVAQTEADSPAVPYATASCGKGACAVTGLPDGRFAVANSFADAVTVIEPARPEEAALQAQVASVPKGLAASQSYLGVIARVPPALHLFSHDSDTAAGVIPLDAPPVAVAAVDSDSFAVATETGLVMVDAPRRAIVARSGERAVDLASDGERLLALTDDAAVIMDRALAKSGSIALSGPARAIAAGGGMVVASSPQTKDWQIATVAEETVPVAGRRDDTPPSPAPTQPVKAEALPEAVEAESVERTPSPRTPAPAPEQPEAPETRDTPREETAEATDTSQAQVKESVEPAPERTRTPPGTYGRVPLGAVEPRAPLLDRRPSASVLKAPAKKTIFDALSEPFEAGPVEGGFQPPDWTQPLRDLRFDTAVGSLGGDEYTAEGNVRLRLDTLDFAADRFSHNQEAGEFRAEGDVVIRQNLSLLSADELYYKVQDESLLPAPSLLEANLDEQARAKRRLSLGMLDARNVYVLEPTRELTADEIHYDFAARTGDVLNARGHAGIYYFRAAKLRMLGPAGIDGEDVWVTTCDHDPPHYKIRLTKAAIRDGQVTEGTHARLQFGKYFTPAYWPHWRFRGRGQDFDFDSGHRAAIGYYVNVGQHFPVTPDVTLGLRLFPTTKEGVGLGLESEYDFMASPASPLFRSKGTVRTLYTTERRGHFELYHRHEVTENTLLLLQSEQWFDRDFYKDFYYERYRNRTEPRTFANLALTKPTYIATATVRKDTHDFVRETERLPEATFHLLERRVAPNLYFAFDAIDGYNERQPADLHAVRLSNVGRLTLDLDWHQALSITPFVEVEGTWYSEERNSDDASFRFSNTIGTTLQTRLHKAYPGRLGFSGFKHLIVPSITYSYRPETSMDVERTPRFDAADNVYGRSRIESKIDNVVFGRDAETEEVWQVARLTLYQGNDFWNENRNAEDYEVEFDIRPRPWWGWQMIGERHVISNDYDLDEPFVVERALLNLYEQVAGKPWDPETAYQYDARYGDYNRLLSYLYYDEAPRGGNLNGRLGFAYAETRRRVFNREVLYGLGYKLGDSWGLAFEHRYDLERDRLVRQRYELRRRLHCWDMTLQMTERESGWDVGVEFNIVAFPGTKLKF